MKKFVLSQVYLENPKTKIPCDPFTGNHTRLDESTNYVNNVEYARVLADQLTLSSAGRYHYLPALALTPKNKMEWCIDIDGCYDPTSGRLNELALDVLGTLPCTPYVELSYSGTGIHIIGTSPTPVKDHACKRNGIEFYSSNKVIALTGRLLYPVERSICDPNAVIDKYVPASAPLSSAEWTNVAIDGVTINDDMVISAARKRASDKLRNLVRGKASFVELYDRDAEKLSDHFQPSDPEKCPFDQSSAELALCGWLMHYSRGNCDQVQRLFLQSPLWRQREGLREKEHHKTYVRDTILRAHAFFCDANVKKIEQIKKGYNTQDRHIHFDEFHRMLEPYVLDTGEGKIYSRKTHEYLSSTSFNNRLGGGHYYVTMDKSVTTPYEAIQKNHAVNMLEVGGIEVDPTKPYDTINDNLLNVYQRHLEPSPGDITPFLDLLSKMMPNDKDILLSWLSMFFQRPGKLIGWMPIIQGGNGNGKSTIDNIISGIVGEKYTGKLTLDSDQSLANNDFILGKLIYLLGDITQNVNKYGLQNFLKEIITEEYIAIKGKYVRHRVVRNYGNCLATTNYLDAIQIIEGNDRRFCVIKTEQQCLDDNIESGLNKDYFDNLYYWLKNNDGYAKIYSYLLNAPIMYDTRTAPRSYYYNEIVECSYTAFQSSILDAIDSNIPGITRDVIITICLQPILDAHNKKSPKSYFKELNNMGYVKHPHLKRGYTPRRLKNYGCQSVIYVRRNSDLSKIRDYDQIMQYLDSM